MRFRDRGRRAQVLAVVLVLGAVSGCARGGDTVRCWVLAVCVVETPVPVV